MLRLSGANTIRYTKIRDLNEENKQLAHNITSKLEQINLDLKHIKEQNHDLTKQNQNLEDHIISQAQDLETHKALA